MSRPLAEIRGEAEEALAKLSLVGPPAPALTWVSIKASALRALLAATPGDGASAPDEALTAYCDVCESDRRVPCHSTTTGEVAPYPHPERVVAARAAKGGE